MARINPKTKKVQMYFPKRTENESFIRHFIHTKKSLGFWAFVRDLTLNEIVKNTTIDIKNDLFIETNFHSKIVELWQAPLIIIFNNKTYKISAKPDEVFYLNKELKINAVEFEDTKFYEDEDEYEL